MRVLEIWELGLADLVYSGDLVTVGRYTPQVKPRGRSVDKARRSESRRRLREAIARRQQQAIGLCDGVIDIVAAVFAIPSSEIRNADKRNIDAARARQIAMYLAHVVLTIPMGDVGIGFARDRKAVIHACHLVEDMRDDDAFDGVVASVERILIVAFRDYLEAL